MAEHKYRLIYFDGRGRAEVARYLFVLGGANFEDQRVTNEQWPEIKPTTPYGQVPSLEVDGKMYCQSDAIYRYVARQFGFYGKDNVDGLRIDQILGVLGDVLQEVGKISYTLPDGEQKVKAIETLKTQSVPKLLKFLEGQLGEHKFFLGDSVSLADAATFEALTGAIGRVAGHDWQEQSPKIKALTESFEALPAIAKYIAQRPQSAW